MKMKPWTIEQILYFSAFLLALGVRLLRLGVAPLSDFEANWALQALDVSHGGHPVLGAQPVYPLVTGLFFYIFGDNNGLARLLPALAGSILVFLPLLWKQSLGRVVGLILAFGLALDPGLVAISRLAGGPMPGLSFGLLALSFAYLRCPALAGLLGGLALLSGVPVVTGAIGLALAWGAAVLLESTSVLTPLPEAGPPPAPARPAIQSWWIGLLFALGTVVIVGTLFLLVPQGIASLADTLPAYFKGWLNPSGIPILRLLGAILFYQPLVLIFGVVGAVRGWVRSEPVSQRLSLWCLAAFILGLAYPSRQPGDLVWMLVPLWALAALEFTRHLPAADDDAKVRLVAGLHAGAVAALLVIVWLALISQITGTSWALASRFIVVVMLMVAAITVIVAMWSSKAARYGLVWGVSAVLGVGMLAAMWGGAQLRPNGAQELWSIGPAAGEVDLFLHTFEDLSWWKKGTPESIDVVVVSDSPSLRWALRDFRGVRFASELSVVGLTVDRSPSVVIMHQSHSIPSLPLVYRGQDFIWRSYPAWKGMIPSDWLRWLASREAPLAQDQIILWARTDLFPGGVIIDSTVLPEQVSPDVQEPAP